MAARTHQFHLLDGMRGVAACVVLWFHLGLSGFGHGYLAVDFFFMLSGFVIAYAYQQALDEGLAFRDFMAMRVARLYPLYLLGLLLGFSWTVPHVANGSVHLSAWTTVADLVLGLCFVPTPTSMGPGNGAMFPYNVVLWSLFFELLANAGHALFLRRRRTPVLVAVAALAAAGLLWQALRTHGLDVGTRTDQMFGGLCRVVFGYGMGMLLLRIWRKGVARVAVPAAVPVLLLPAVLYPPRIGWAYDMIMVVVMLPCVVLLAAYSAVPTSLAHVCASLGAASYAVYVLHTPVCLYLDTMVRRLHHPLPALARKLPEAAVVLVLAWLADRYYDTRARTWLRRRLVREPAVTSTQEARLHLEAEA